MSKKNRPHFDEVPAEAYEADALNEAHPELRASNSVKPAEPYFQTIGHFREDPEALIPPTPDWVAVDDGEPLLYEKRSHLLYGESTTGKSLFALKCGIDVAAIHGVRICYLDYEDSLQLFASRAFRQGLPEDADSKVFYKRGVRMDGDSGKELRARLQEAGIGLIIVDSLAAAMAVSGCEENSNSEIRKWWEDAVTSLDAAGIASLFVDHVGHERTDGPAGRKYNSRGGTAKRDSVTGASYLLEATDPIGREPGTYRLLLSCAKDRMGNRRPKIDTVDVSFIVSEDGETERFTLSQGKGAHSFREESVSAMKERLSKALEKSEDGFTANWFRQNGGEGGAMLSSRVVNAARDALEAGEFIEIVDGPRGAKVMKSLKPFRRSGQGQLTEEAPF